MWIARWKVDLFAIRTCGLDMFCEQDSGPERIMLKCRLNYKPEVNTSQAKTKHFYKKMLCFCCRGVHDQEGRARGREGGGEGGWPSKTPKTTHPRLQQGPFTQKVIRVKHICQICVAGAVAGAALICLQSSLQNSSAHSSQASIS